VTFDYHSFGAQKALSLLAGTYVDGDMCTYTASGTLLNCSTAVPSGSGTVSGQANGVIPLATAATAIGAQSHLDDGVTTAATITSSEPLAVGGGTPLPGALVNAVKSVIAGTAQINVQNTSSDNAASSDVVATSDNGSNTTDYVDMGCNSSTYNQAAYNSGAADDCYLYAQSGNLNIATATSGKTVTVNVGGTTTAQTVATFSSTGLSVTGSVAESN